MPQKQATEKVPAVEVNPLTLSLARGFRWRKLLDTREFATQNDLTRTLGVIRPYVSRMVRLTLLAPISSRPSLKAGSHRGCRLKLSPSKKSPANGGPAEGVRVPGGRMMENRGDMTEAVRYIPKKSQKNVVIAPPPPRSAMDASYFELRDAIVGRIKETRLRFILRANAGMIELYWHIGNDILRRQKSEGWGAKVIDRLSADLKEEFPEMGGFSPRNLKYMRKFAENWPDPAIVQQPVAQLQWRSVLTLLTKIQDNPTREWYARKALECGWSSSALDHMVDLRLADREGKAVTNFRAALPPPDSDMAVQVFKDPYLFDFLGTAEARREAEIERALVVRMEKFLLELGQGFAFVGRQVRLEVGGDEFFIDLLFYHLKLRCYVVIELKARDFSPGDVSKLNMYQNAVNAALRHPDDKPTIGLLLVKGKNRTVVEYSLMGYTNPMGVADWKNQLAAAVPDDLKSSLPSVEEIEREMEFVADANTATPPIQKRRKPKPC